MNTLLAAVLITGMVMTAGHEEGQGFTQPDINFVRELCLNAKLTQIGIIYNEIGEAVEIKCTRGDKG